MKNIKNHYVVISLTLILIVFHLFSSEKMPEGGYAEVIINTSDKTTENNNKPLAVKDAGELNNHDLYEKILNKNEFLEIKQFIIDSYSIEFLGKKLTTDEIRKIKESLGNTLDGVHYTKKNKEYTYLLDKIENSNECEVRKNLLIKSGKTICFKDLIIEKAFNEDAIVVYHNETDNLIQSYAFGLWFQQNLKERSHTQNRLNKILPFISQKYDISKGTVCKKYICYLSKKFNQNELAHFYSDLENYNPTCQVRLVRTSMYRSPSVHEIHCKSENY